MTLKNNRDLRTVVEYRPFWNQCPNCKADLGPECTEDDPCIANCPGTDDACCGHGYTGAAYVEIDDPPFIAQKVLQGKEALEYFAKFNLGPLRLKGKNA